jgi:protein SCO1/2
MRGLLMALLLLFSSAHAAEIGGHFSLVDQDGRHVTDQSFVGKPVLLYFGFTACPDVCPTDLAKIVKIAAAIHTATGIVVTPVFVSIDPERDTPARLKAYVKSFGKDFVGLTGSPAQIAAIGDEYHVYYKKVPFGTRGDYMMDHSTVLFLLGADGAYLDHYGRALTAEEIVPRAVAKLR